MGTTSGLDRRTAERFPLHWEVRLLPLHWEVRLEQGRGLTRDISARGLFMDTDTPVAPDQAIQILVIPPAHLGSGRIWCQARVVRVCQQPGESGYATGVALDFDEVSFSRGLLHGGRDDAASREGSHAPWSHALHRHASQTSSRAGRWHERSAPESASSALRGLDAAALEPASCSQVPRDCNHAASSR